jgi:hypothetical protein
MKTKFIHSVYWGLKLKLVSRSSLDILDNITSRRCYLQITTKIRISEKLKLQNNMKIGASHSELSLTAISNNRFIE